MCCYSVKMNIYGSLDFGFDKFYLAFGTRFVDAFIQEMKKWTSGITDNPQAHVTNQVEKY